MEQNIESSDVDSHKNNQLIFDEEAKANQWKNDGIFNQWC